jgi:hypothetical protein
VSAAVENRRCRFSAILIAMPIQPLLQVEAALIRRQLPDLLLRPGMTLAARVSERSGRHGIIMLAGAPLVAELPDEVGVGDKLRLLVQDTRGGKVVMKLVADEPLAPPQQSVIPLPGGLTARVRVEERDATGGPADGEQASITLLYNGEAIGSVGLRLALVPRGVTIDAELAAGRAYELADDAADALRRRLEAATGRSAQVTVRPRRDPLDVYA